MWIFVVIFQINNVLIDGAGINEMISNNIIFKLHIILLS